MEHLDKIFPVSENDAPLAPQPYYCLGCNQIKPDSHDTIDCAMKDDLEYQETIRRITEYTEWWHNHG